MFMPSGVTAMSAIHSDQTLYCNTEATMSFCLRNLGPFCMLRGVCGCDRPATAWKLCCSLLSALLSSSHHTPNSYSLI
jgi:hypothetical protein